MADKTKKKILLFTDWYYPAFKAGGPVQSCHNIVKALGDQYLFYVLTSDRDLGDKEPYPDIETGNWVQGKDKEYVCYLFRNAMNPGAVRRILHEIQPDLVYFNSMFSLLYTLIPLWVLQRTRYQGRVLLAPRGMLHAGALARKGIKKNIFLRTFWLSGWPSRLVFHVTDLQEKRDVKRFFPRAKQVILAENIPNIDSLPVINRPKEKGDLALVFISRVHPKKNLLFLLDLLMNTTVVGNIQLDIYGETDDIAYEKQCRQMAARLASNIAVQFKGPLQHHLVFPTLHQYHLFILPTLGENFGHAVFESLSSGTPVLISDKTPWTKLEAAHAGWDLPLCQPEKYREVIAKVLAMTGQEYAIWQSGALDYARQFLQDADPVSKYSKLFQ